MGKRKIRFFKIILLALILFIFTGCKSSGNNNDITLVLDWTPNTNHTGFIVALEKGYYEEEGINLKIVQPPEDGSIPLVATGKAQFGITTQEDLGIALSNNKFPVTAVATILQHNTSGIISLKEDNIESFKDLENKTYATWGLPFEQAILKQVMEDEGASFENVKLYYSTVTDVFSALQTNVDAIWVYEGWDVVLAEQLGLDFNFIKFKDVNPILDFYTPILVGNSNFLEDNRDIVIKFLSATKKGYEFAIENLEESAEILVKYYPEIDFKLSLESQKYLANEYMAESEQWGVIDPERWNSFFNWAYEMGIIPVNLENIGFTNEFLLDTEVGEK